MAEDALVVALIAGGGAVIEESAGEHARDGDHTLARLRLRVGDRQPVLAQVDVPPAERLRLCPPDTRQDEQEEERAGLLVVEAARERLHLLRLQGHTRALPHPR